MSGQKENTPEALQINASGVKSKWRDSNPRPFGPELSATIHIKK